MRIEGSGMDPSRAASSKSRRVEANIRNGAQAAASFSM